MSIKLSIIIPVLNSHMVVKRQIRHFRRLRLPDDVEIILMDDGSDPPLEFPDMGLRNLTIYPTHDKRLWTPCLARNKGAEIARGEYLLMTDIDHILSKHAIAAAHAFTGDRMHFFRFIAILSARGAIVQNLDALFKFGFSRGRYAKHNLGAGSHTNTFCIRKSVFDALGGYNLFRCTMQRHTCHDDADLNKRWMVSVRAGIYKSSVLGPPIYMYPVGRFNATGATNPNGLFHSQPRDDLGQR